MDVLLLSRLQFALTVMFHYLFPPLTIGLGVLMVVMEGLFLRTRDPVYEAISRFWTRIFAVNFAMGVATGVVMEFQFGTNWAAYSRFVGDVFGSALAAEGIFAFFLESGFLAVVVFGWDRVSPRMHFFSTCMVALGSMFSAVWIVVANSWQQTPAGYHLVREGTRVRAEITDFWAVVFNPSSVDRLVHVLLGALVLAAFFVMSIAAWYALRGRHLVHAGRMMQVALVQAALASCLIWVSGDIQARKVAQTQPAKLAACEGHFETGTGPTPLYLFGVPDEAEQRVRWGVSVPGMLSWLVHGDGRPVTGLDRFPPADRPPVLLPFASFHLMVALGVVLAAGSLFGLLFWWRGTLLLQRWLLWFFVFAVAGAYLANQLGWVVAEVGRQPWTVYGLLRTADSGSAAVSAAPVMASMAMFGTMYLLLFAVWLYVLNDKIRHGPEETRGPAAGGLMEAAAALAEPGGPSLTDAHPDEEA